MNILITGGASGLGEAITRKLANNADNHVYFTYHNSAVKAKLIELEFTNCTSIKCNFDNDDEINSLLSTIGGMSIDILINNAYTVDFTPKHFHKTNPSVFIENFISNIYPTIKISQSAILHFRKKKFGKIINILSTFIIDNPPIGWSVYTASKAYLESLSKSWANENINYSITSNSISPSFMLTNLTTSTDERVVDEMKSSHPLKKILTTDEVSEAVLFFINCSQQINGVNLIINAGSHVI